MPLQQDPTDNAAALPASARIPVSASKRSLLPALAFFVLFTLACGDVLSLPIAGGNFRLFYLFGLLVFVLWLDKVRFDPGFALRIVFLLTALAPSLVMSIDSSRSVLYAIWIGLTLVCTFGAFPRLLDFTEKGTPMLGGFRLYDVILYAFRFQIIFGIALFLLGLHDRTRFLYYESSYFSISLAVYCSVVAYRFREKRPVALDLTLILAYLVTSVSGAFVLVLLVTIMLNMPRTRARHLIPGAAALALTVAGYVTFVDDINTALIRSLFTSDIDYYAVLLRGGNRLARLIAAWNVFTDHSVFGIGLGSFETFSRSMDIDAPGTADYLSGEGKPAINIYLELLATAGIAGFFGFALLLFPVLRWIFGKGFQSPISRGVVCMLLILTWESNFLRPYLWVMLALCWAEMRHAGSLVLMTRSKQC